MGPFRARLESLCDSSSDAPWGCDATDKVSRSPARSTRLPGARWVVIGSFSQQFSKLLDGRVGFANVRSKSVKKLLIIYSKRSGRLRRNQPGIRGPVCSARTPGARGGVMALRQ